MQENIIPENIVFNNCYSGTEFGNKTVDFLRLVGLTANRVGKANDGGIDIEASMLDQNSRLPDTQLAALYVGIVEHQTIRNFAQKINVSRSTAA